MSTTAPDTRGILDPARLLAQVRLERLPPSPALAPIVDRIWVVEWDRREDGPCEQFTLPDPVVNLVLEPGFAGVYGVQRHRFARRLTGRGRAVAVKFRPGGFRELLGRPMSEITDRTIPAAEVLGDGVADLHERIEALPETDAVQALEEFLLERAGTPREHPVTQIAELVATDLTITRVEDLAERVNRSPRQLQRMFSDAVGAAPKWVIRRHRLVEAADTARFGASPDWARVASDLGFSDQAHLVRSFTALVGLPPAKYAREGVGVAP